MDATFEKKKFTFYLQYYPVLFHYSDSKPLNKPLHAVRAEYVTSVDGILKTFRLCFKCMKLYVEINNLKQCSSVYRYYEFIPFEIELDSNFLDVVILNVSEEYWCIVCRQTMLFEILSLSECKQKIRCRRES